MFDLTGQTALVMDGAATIDWAESNGAREFIVGDSGGWAKVYETDEKLPKLILNVPTRGSREIDLQSAVDAGGDVPCMVPGPDGIEAVRVRGGLGFSDGANLCFQALAADGGKAAFRALTRECYLGQRTVYDDPRMPIKPRYTFEPPGTPGWPSGRSPLFGCRLPFFVHDEVMAEVPFSRAHEAATRMVEVMQHVMQAYVPDVPVRAEPALMYRWSKAAEARYDGGGRLLPWDAP